MKDKISTLITEAETLRGESQYSESLKLFKKAFSLSKKHSYLNGLIDSNLAIADIYRISGDFDKAISKYSEVIEICDAVGFDRTKADAIVGIALSLRAKGLWKEALDNIKVAISFYKKKKDKKGVAFSLWAEGGVLRVKGDITSAIAKFNESMEIFSSIRFKSGIGYALCGLGGAKRMAGNNAESMDNYKKANKIFTELNDKFGIAYSFCGIGNAYRMKNDFDIAMDFFLKASSLYKEFNDIVSHSYTLWSIANVLKMKGIFLDAINYLNIALKNFKKTKDNRGIAYCMLTRGEIDLIEGKYKQAEKLFNLALEITESFNFALEKCHAKSLLGFLKFKDSSDIVKSNIKCYEKIGVKVYPKEIPYNMP